MDKLTDSEDVLALMLAEPEFRRDWERHAVAHAVALWLVRYRAEHSLTQEQLAALVRLRQPTIARLEAGEVEPKLSTLLRLSARLGVPLELRIDRTGDLAEAETVIIGGTLARAA